MKCKYKVGHYFLKKYVKLKLQAQNLHFINSFFKEKILLLTRIVVDIILIKLVLFFLLAYISSYVNVYMTSS